MTPSCVSRKDATRDVCLPLPCPLSPPAPRPKQRSEATVQTNPEKGDKLLGYAVFFSLILSFLSPLLPDLREGYKG